jgi:hypothetical protein
MTDPELTRGELVARLREIALNPPTSEQIAAREAARTDPWRWYCRLCGAGGAVSDGLGAREYRDKAAEEHLRETRCGRFEVCAREESGRLLHVWTYPRTAVARWN